MCPPNNLSMPSPPPSPCSVARCRGLTVVPVPPRPAPRGGLYSPPPFRTVVKREAADGPHVVKTPVPLRAPASAPQPVRRGGWGLLCHDTLADHELLGGRVSFRNLWGDI